MTNAPSPFHFDYCVNDNLGDPSKPSVAWFIKNNVDILSRFFHITANKVGTKSTMATFSFYEARLLGGGSMGRAYDDNHIALSSDAKSYLLDGKGTLARLVMHEMLHRVLVRGNGNAHDHVDHLPVYLTVMKDRLLPTSLPALGLDDFYQLGKKFGYRSPEGNTTYSWAVNNGRYETSINGKIAHNWASNYLYDLVYDTSGTNTFDFSNQTAKVFVDLRAAGVKDGHIDRTMAYGSYLLGSHETPVFQRVFIAPGAVIQNAKAGSSGGTMIGNQAANMLQGGVGAETLSGLLGHDTINGGAGADTVNYSLDAKNGGTKGVFVNLSSQRQRLPGRAVAALSARDGFDNVDKLISIENAIGGIGDDVIYAIDAASTGATGSVINGDAGNDALWGGIGRDRLYGDAGNDSLWGSRGNDWLEGGDGNDRLAGQQDNDTLVGGSGADLFIFNRRYGQDLIKDFNAAEGDRLSIDRRLATDWTQLWNSRRFENGNLILSFRDRHMLTLEGVNSLSPSQIMFF